MTIPRNIALVVNPHLSKSLSIADTVISLLKAKSIEHTLFITPWPLNWIDFTEAWIIGGDGTLNYFINHYPQFELPLTIFKGGTNNAFHELLYGRVSIEQQVEIVLSATPQAVDAGLCNNKLFIHSVDIGLNARIARSLAGKPKKYGTASHLFAILRSIFGFKAFLCTVNTEDFHWGKKCLLINVSNSKAYGLAVSPKSSLNDGRLDTRVIGKIHPLFRGRYLPLITKGKHLDLPFVTYVKSAMVIVKALQELPARIDGEVFSATEFNIECLPDRFLFLYQVLHPSFLDKSLYQQ